MTETTIAIADDHPLMRRGLTDLFRDYPQYALVGEAVDAPTTLALVEAAGPQILIMDFSMPGDVVETIRQISVDFPGTRIIILTAFSSVDSAIKALDAGAMGFVLKGCPASEILEAIEAARTDQLYIARQYAAEVLLGLRRRDHHREVAAAVRLNVRERQIVGHLMQARTNKEIAESLNLTEKTVKYYMASLMTKFNARNRVEVALAAKGSIEI